MSNALLTCEIAHLHRELLIDDQRVGHKWTNVAVAPFHEHYDMCMFKKLFNNLHLETKWFGEQVSEKASWSKFDHQTGYEIGFLLESTDKTDFPPLKSAV